ncbi:ATPase, T2SS/T4P/T4SS family [Agromyces bauzanensis]
MTTPERDILSLPLLQGLPRNEDQWAPPNQTSEPVSTPQPAPAEVTAAQHLAAAMGAPTAAPTPDVAGVPFTIETTPAAYLPQVSQPTPYGTPAQPTISAPAQGTAGELDWGLVTAFRSEVSNRMVAELNAGQFDGAEQAELGRRLIVDVLTEHNEARMRAEGAYRWEEAMFDRMTRAVYDALFRLGRLQPLVDDARVENIMIFGNDKVYVDYGGGQYEPRPPVADSDQELIEMLQFFASREGDRGRPFSAVHWKLPLTLPGGERLQAIHPPITPRPHVVIRRHPLISTTLDDLVEKGTLSIGMVEFLSAAVRARKSIVVAGQQGAGKTTLVRALAHAIDPWEHIVTIEGERELHLDKSGLHHMVTPFEARPGQGEMNADGSRAGEVTLEELIVESLRHNTHRVIVGEVRGPEVTAMIQAMQAGAGSMSTIHANTPSETIERIAVLLSKGISASNDFGYKLIGQHIDFIVQLSNFVGGDRTETRFISEISELVPGEGARPIAQAIYKAPRGATRAELVARPQEETINDLEHVGYDPDWLIPGREGERYSK